MKLPENKRTMNFSGEDRKDVFFFFEYVLKSYKQPVYYENLRGHVSQAPDNIRKYVLHKCRGDHFLDYFKRRKNYFNVENGNISLKVESSDDQLGNSYSNKSKKKGSKGKFLKRSTNYSYSSYASALKGNDSNKNVAKEYESIAINYFRNRLIRKKKERLWAIEFIDLPKKVKRHLQIYYKSNVKCFLCDFPEKFLIDSDNETVTLAYVCESNTNVANPFTVNQESSTNFNQDFADIIVDSDIKKVSEYLECVKFFIEVLKKLNQPFSIEKLGGYFSQASKEIKEYVKMNYRTFKCFFDDAPSIFLKNTSEEVSLSKEYKKRIKAAENLLKKSKDGLTLQSEESLKLHFDLIFRPKISSQPPLSCLEETDSNNKNMQFECMTNTDEDLSEKMLKLDISELHSEMPFESTEDFFDNYLMRSNSRESSKSLSSRSTRSTSAEDCSVIKKLESKQIQGFSDKEVSENTFLEYILTVELFCVEFMESELNYLQSNENKAVEYFTEILHTSSTKAWKLNSLQGSIGNNREIAQFMNKLYKGERFVSFFQSHPQFRVDQPFITLCNEANCTKDFTNEKNATKNVKDLYELNDFKILLKETYVYLYEVCKFCKDKSVKVERLSGILAKFPSCLNMVKTFKGQLLHDKIEYFLRGTMMFKFPEIGNIYFPYYHLNKTCHILFVWFEKINCHDPLVQFVSFSDFWKNNTHSISISDSSNEHVDLEKHYQNLVNIVEAEIKNRLDMNYNELSKIIPEYFLSAMACDNYYSKFMVSALLRSGKFRMENGKISLHTVSEYYNFNNEDNGQIETIRGFQNDISEENSDKLYNQRHVCDNNLIRNASSLFIDSKEKCYHSKESKIEMAYCSNQYSQILPVKDHCNMNSPSTEIKSNLNFNDDKTTGNPCLTSANKNEHLNSINDNFISKISKKSILQDGSEGDENMCITKENLGCEIPLTDANGFNSIMECSKVSKSILSSKALDSVEENESVDRSTEKIFNSEDKINNKIVSPLHTSGVLKELNIPSLFQSPEFEDHPKESQALLSMCDSASIIISKDLSKEEDELSNDQMQLSFNERCNISVKTKFESLEKASLAEHNILHGVSNENILDSSIKTSKVGQNIFSKCKDKESAKLEIDLGIKQNPNDHLKAKTEKIKGQLLDDLEQNNEEKRSNSVKPELKSLEIDSFAEQDVSHEVSNENIIESNIKTSQRKENVVFEHKDEESTKLEIDLDIEQNSNGHLNAKTETPQRQFLNNLELTNEVKFNNSIKPKLEPLLKDSFAKQDVIYEVSNINIVESNIKTSKKKQNIVFKYKEEESTKLEIDLDIKQNSNNHLKTEMTKGQLLDNLEVTTEDKHSTSENRNWNNCKSSEKTEKEFFRSDVLQVSNFNETQTEKIPVIIKDFKKEKKHKEFQSTINKNVSAEQSFMYTPEELFDTSLLKQYLNCESSNRRALVTNEMHFEYSSVGPTSFSVESKEINIPRSIYNDLSSKCPMQLFSANVVLLTNNSCIALANINEYKQNIYFFKYVFVCEHESDCLHCFSALQIGDHVSCLVPLTEISQRVWIAFMVTKDNSDHFNELGVFKKLKENAQAIYEECANTLPFSACIKSSVRHFGCQTDFPKCDNSCQTYLSKDIDLYKASKESSPQTSLVSVKCVSVQTEKEKMACGDQIDLKNSEVPLHKKCSRSQIYFIDDSEKNGLTENTTFQSIWHEGKNNFKKNISCQTFATGNIYMTELHPM